MIDERECEDEFLGKLAQIVVEHEFLHQFASLNALHTYITGSEQGFRQKLADFLTDTREDLALHH